MQTSRKSGNQKRRYRDVFQTEGFEAGDQHGQAADQDRVPAIGQAGQFDRFDGFKIQHFIAEE